MNNFGDTTSHLANFIQILHRQSIIDMEDGSDTVFQICLPSIPIDPKNLNSEVEIKTQIQYDFLPSYNQVVWNPSDDQILSQQILDIFTKMEIKYRAQLKSISNQELQAVNEEIENIQSKIDLLKYQNQKNIKSLNLKRDDEVQIKQKIKNCLNQIQMENLKMKELIQQNLLVALKIYQNSIKKFQAQGGLSVTFDPENIKDLFALDLISNAQGFQKLVYDSNKIQENMDNAQDPIMQQLYKKLQDYGIGKIKEQGGLTYPINDIFQSLKIELEWKKVNFQRDWLNISLLQSSLSDLNQQVQKQSSQIPQNFDKIIPFIQVAAIIVRNIQIQGYKNDKQFQRDLKKMNMEYNNIFALLFKISSDFYENDFEIINPNGIIKSSAPRIIGYILKPIYPVQPEEIEFEFSATDNSFVLQKLKENNVSLEDITMWKQNQKIKVRFIYQNIAYPYYKNLENLYQECIDEWNFSKQLQISIDNNRNVDIRQDYKEGYQLLHVRIDNSRQVFTLGIGQFLRDIKNNSDYNQLFGLKEFTTLVNEKDPNQNIIQKCRRVILHELGYVMGFIKEQQKLDKQNEIDNQKVINFYKLNLQKLSKDQILIISQDEVEKQCKIRAQINVFNSFDHKDFRDYDEQSIMLQPIPSAWLKLPQKQFQNNCVSQMDQKILIQNYQMFQTINIKSEFLNKTNQNEQNVKQNPEIDQGPKENGQKQQIKQSKYGELNVPQNQDEKDYLFPKIRIRDRKNINPDKQQNMSTYDTTGDQKTISDKQNLKCDSIGNSQISQPNTPTPTPQQNIQMNRFGQQYNKQDDNNQINKQVNQNSDQIIHSRKIMMPINNEQEEEKKNKQDKYGQINNCNQKNEYVPGRFGEIPTPNPDPIINKQKIDKPPTPGLSHPQVNSSRYNKEIENLRGEILQYIQYEYQQDDIVDFIIQEHRNIEVIKNWKQQLESLIQEVSTNYNPQQLEQEKANKFLGLQIPKLDDDKKEIIVKLLLDKTSRDMLRTRMLPKLQGISNETFSVFQNIYNDYEAITNKLENVTNTEMKLCLELLKKQADSNFSQIQKQTLVHAAILQQIYVEGINKYETQVELLDLFINKDQGDENIKDQYHQFAIMFFKEDQKLKDILIDNFKMDSHNYSKIRQYCINNNIATFLLQNEIEEFINNIYNQKNLIEKKKSFKFITNLIKTDQVYSLQLLYYLNRLQVDQEQQAKQTQIIKIDPKKTWAIQDKNYTVIHVNQNTNIARVINKAFIIINSQNLNQAYDFQIEYEDRKLFDGQDQEEVQKFIKEFQSYFNQNKQRNELISLFEKQIKTSKLIMNQKDYLYLEKYLEEERGYEQLMSLIGKRKQDEDHSDDINYEDLEKISQNVKFSIILHQEGDFKNFKVFGENFSNEKQSINIIDHSKSSTYSILKLINLKFQLDTISVDDFKARNKEIYDIMPRWMQVFFGYRSLLNYICNLNNTKGTGDSKNLKVNTKEIQNLEDLARIYDKYEKDPTDDLFRLTQQQSISLMCSDKFIFDEWYFKIQNQGEQGKKFSEQFDIFVARTNPEHLLKIQMTTKKNFPDQNKLLTLVDFNKMNSRIDQNELNKVLKQSMNDPQQFSTAVINQLFGFPQGSQQATCYKTVI